MESLLQTSPITQFLRALKVREDNPSVHLGELTFQVMLFISWLVLGVICISVFC